MDLQKFKDLMVIVSFAAITAMFFYGKTFRSNPQQKTSQASVMEIQIFRDSGEKAKQKSVKLPLEMSQFDM